MFDHFVGLALKGLNIRAVCDCKYFFEDVVVKSSEGVHEPQIFLNPVLLGDPAYTVLLVLIKKCFGGGRNERERFFNSKL